MGDPTSPSLGRKATPTLRRGSAKNVAHEITALSFASVKPTTTKKTVTPAPVTVKLNNTDRVELARPSLHNPVYPFSRLFHGPYGIYYLRTTAGPILEIHALWLKACMRFAAELNHLRGQPGRAMRNAEPFGYRALAEELNNDTAQQVKLPTISTNSKVSFTHGTFPLTVNFPDLERISLGETVLARYGPDFDPNMLNKIALKVAAASMGMGNNNNVYRGGNNRGYRGPRGGRGGFRGQGNHATGRSAPY